MKYLPPNARQTPLPADAEVRWGLVHVDPDQADEGRRYQVYDTETGVVRLFGSRRQARETVLQLLAAGVKSVPIRTVQEERDLTAIRKREITIQERWPSIFNLATIGYFALCFPHMGTVERHWLAASLLVCLFVYLRSWWLWWQNEYPLGVRVLVRHWARTPSMPDSPPPDVDDEHTWPPPPRRGQ